MIRILLVEDNVPYRKLLAIHLVRAGYDVVESDDGLDALDVLKQKSIQLIVADIMMPRMDGFSLISHLRNKGETLPILVITAKEHFDAMRESFQRGADDYLMKPVRTEELLLRIEALLRRCGSVEAEDTRIGRCIISEKTLTVTCDDLQKELRPKEMQLLAKLARYPGKIFTRQELMDDIWGYDSLSDPRTVDTHIKRLREKLEGFSDIQIRTVRGLGYRLERIR